MPGAGGSSVRVVGFQAEEGVAPREQAGRPVRVAVPPEAAQREPLVVVVAVALSRAAAVAL